jgi:hypothetical protein
MFGASRGRHVLPITINGSTANGVEGIFASAASGTVPGTVVVKLVNPGPAGRNVRMTFPSAFVPTGGVTTTMLTGDPDAENTLTNPRAIAPRLSFDGNPLERELPAHSLTIIDVGIVKR